MKFKTGRQRREFDDVLLDSRLRVMAYALDGFSRRSFSKEILVTDVFRTGSEQRRYYKGVDVPVSVHQHWRGVDLRSWLFTLEEQRVLCRFINGSFVYSGGRKSAVAHRVGDGAWHFHLQVDWDGETVLKKFTI